MRVKKLNLDILLPPVNLAKLSRFLSSPPQAKGDYSFSLKCVFLNLDPSGESGFYGQALLGYDKVFVDRSDGL